MSLRTILTNARRVHLLYAPLLVSAPDNVHQVQCGRIRNKRVSQSLQGIGEENGSVVVLAGERMRAHERPVHVGRYGLGEE